VLDDDLVEAAAGSLGDGRLEEPGSCGRQTTNQGFGFDANGRSPVESRPARLSEAPGNLFRKPARMNGLRAGMTNSISSTPHAKSQGSSRVDVSLPTSLPDALSWSRWDPHSVLVVISAELGLAGEEVTVAQLERQLPARPLSPVVLARAAEALKVEPRALRDYLGSRPWVDAKGLPLVAPRNIEARQAELLDYAIVPGDPSYKVTGHVHIDWELQRSGIGPKLAQTLRSRSKGLVGVDAFLAQFKLPKRADDDGLYGYLLATQALGRRADLRFAYQVDERYWSEGYDRLIKEDDHHRPHTDRYMDRITRTDEPITFLVPPNFMGAEHANSITRQEFDWLLAHPDRMKNVTFVLGAY
jgi:hypothetical protein